MKNTIMIIDDRRLNIDTFAEILKDKYIIMIAEGGQSAIQTMRRKKPDVVLLNIYMPDIDGYSVLPLMKADSELSDIPVIIVSGEQSAEAEEKGLSMGAADYIKKPFNPAVIRARVQNFVELKAYRDNLGAIVAERTNQLAAYLEALIMGMSLMSENHDKDTGEHIWRIKEFTRILVNKTAEKYSELFPGRLMEQTILFSPLHDIGKVCITDVILRKESSLTKDEYEIMKSHTTKGAEMLKHMELFLVGVNGNSLKTAIEIAEFHHEKYDGTGYPHGLKGEEIPLPARIVAVADVYDALKSKRPYKKSLAHEDVMKIMLSNNKRTNATHFDPKILEVFKENNADFKRLYE